MVPENLCAYPHMTVRGKLLTAEKTVAFRKQGNKKQEGYRNRHNDCALGELLDRVNRNQLSRFQAATVAMGRAIVLANQSLSV